MKYVCISVSVCIVETGSNRKEPICPSHQPKASYHIIKQRLRQASRPPSYQPKASSHIIKQQLRQASRPPSYEPKASSQITEQHRGYASKPPSHQPKTSSHVPKEHPGKTAESPSHQPSEESSEHQKFLEGCAKKMNEKCAEEIATAVFENKITALKIQGLQRTAGTPVAKAVCTFHSYKILFRRAIFLARTFANKMTRTQNHD
ncbi:hypothetical protein RND71_034131 [Anisodus tanguticus]|uniref:Uncharacterized protein n=1 Tax=Anisodus tanguticus TaxID=243964 RepID=A0AAE1RC38_9SOLA|nr:hypothetical protein RND71_034131 [Anisodus tanguticus]